MRNARDSRRRRAASALKGFRLNQVQGESLALNVAKDLWYRLDTPTSLGLYLCARHGDILSILKHTVSPRDYTTAQDFSLDYQATSFLRKCPLSVVSDEERRSAAIQKFWEAEDRCRETNHRFRSRYSGKYSSPGVESVLSKAQRKIYSWIGEAPSASEWLSRCRFGPGSDDQTSGPNVGAYHKLSALSSTEEFVDGAVSMALDHPPWAFSLAFPDRDPSDIAEGERSEITVWVQPGNTIAFVPKTALIFRSIAIEPRMNVWAQLGLGSYLRQLLKSRAGLDLNTQRPNQDLAYEGARFGNLATIDLSSASDTICTMLVRELLPPQWFTALDWVRSHKGQLDGSWINYEKFSSMGNGYTFELESMIFYALALGTCEELGLPTRQVRVFGDDIVCPGEAVKLLEEVLTYCGFKMNPTKSFWEGPFRESCGADFFDATNVRPYFLTEVPIDATSLYNLANGIRRAGHRSGHGVYTDRRYYPAWLRTVRRLPEPLRHLYAPSIITERRWGLDIEAGDGGLALNPDEFLSTSFASFARDYQVGYRFGAVVPRAWEGSEIFGPNTLLTYALYRSRDGLAEGTQPGRITGRGVVGQRVSFKSYTCKLENYGLWS